MDGVLADLVGALFAHLNLDPQPVTSYGGVPAALNNALGFGLFDNRKLWALTEQLGAEWWAAIPDLKSRAVFPKTPRFGPLLPGELYRALSGFAPVQIVTVGQGPRSEFGKRLWLRSHISPCAAEDAIVLPPGASKAHLAEPGALLIDDCEAHVLDWRDAGGIGFLWPAPWNTAGSADLSGVLS